MNIHKEALGVFSSGVGETWGLGPQRQEPLFPKREQQLLKALGSHLLGGTGPAGRAGGLRGCLSFQPGNLTVPPNTPGHAGGDMLQGDSKFMGITPQLAQHLSRSWMFNRGHPFLLFLFHC